MPNSNSKSSSELELLADVVQSLAEELKVLRMAVDELREELQWANHNVHGVDHGGGRWLNGRRIHSFSIDPTSRDFSVNAVDNVTVEKLRSELNPIQTSPGEQGELFN